MQISCGHSATYVTGTFTANRTAAPGRSGTLAPPRTNIRRTLHQLHELQGLARYGGTITTTSLSWGVSGNTRHQYSGHLAIRISERGEK